MRLIDADAFRSEMQEYVFPITENNLMGAADAYHRTVHLLDLAPAIYAEPVKHGRWIMTLYTTTSKRGRIISNKKFECSECGHQNGRKKSNYCPSCGAKMDLEVTP